MNRTLLALALGVSLGATLHVPPAWAQSKKSSEASGEPVDPWGGDAWEPVPEESERVRKGEVLPPPYRGAPVEVGEPRLPIGAVLALSGGLLAIGGATILADAGPEVVVTGQICDGFGNCDTTVEFQDEPSDESPGVGMLVGGLTTTVFGGALLAHRFVEGAPFPHKSSGRVGAGMLLMGYGVGTAVGASAMIMHGAIAGTDDPLIVAFVMYAPAVGLMATGMPLWITGSRPKGKRNAADDPNAKEIMRSPTMGSIGLGMVVLGLGVAGAGIGAAVEGERLEEEDDPVDDFGFSFSSRPDTAVTVLGTLSAGVTLLSLGTPLAIIGLSKTKPSEAHASGEELEVPEVAISPMGSRVTWRF